MLKNALFLLTVILIFTVSCQKATYVKSGDNGQLTGYRMEIGADTFNYKFFYNSDDKIASIMYRKNNEQYKNLWHIRYDSNEILMMCEESSASIIIRDTLRITIDGSNKVTKRIQSHFYQDQSLANATISRTHETNYYQYDAAGLIIKEIRRSSDSTYYYLGTGSLVGGRSTEVLDYTNSNGKIVSISQQSRDTSISGNVQIRETIVTFDYEKAYANKTDFSNEATLSPIHIFFPYPMDNQYTHLPEKINFNVVKKDKNGIVTSSSSYSYLYDFSYDSTGHIIGKTTSNTQLQGPAPAKWTYYYRK